MEDVVYTVKELAALLKSNVDYIHNLRKSGVLPFIKLGFYKVRKEAVEEFLAKYEGKDLSDPFNIVDIADVEQQD